MSQSHWLAAVGEVEYPNLALAKRLAQRTGVVAQTPIQLLTADGLVDVTAHQCPLSTFSQLPHCLAT